MKKCPACSTTYTDDTLRFCLADGATLEPVDGPARPGTRSGPWAKIIVGLFVLGALGLLGLGMAGALFYFASAPDPDKAAQTSPTPAPSAKPTEDPDSRRLQEEMANLQRRLEGENTAKTNSQPFPQNDKGEELGSPITATVDSPNDGFLALRSEPSTKTGRLLYKIPHGSEIELNNCEKKQTTVSGRAGRWCMVTYQDQIGWVFDGWLEY